MGEHISAWFPYSDGQINIVRAIAIVEDIHEGEQQLPMGFSPASARFYRRD